MSCETSLTVVMGTTEQDAANHQSKTITGFCVQQQRPSESFVEPQTPCMKSTSLVDLSKRGPGRPGRTASKKRALFW
jgi:hypothetical protein